MTISVPRGSSGLELPPIGHEVKSKKFLCENASQIDLHPHVGWESHTLRGHYATIKCELSALGHSGLHRLCAASTDAIGVVIDTCHDGNLRADRSANEGCVQKSS